jgi:hypothetical protein
MKLFEVNILDEEVKIMVLEWRLKKQKKLLVIERVK